MEGSPAWSKEVLHFDKLNNTVSDLWRPTRVLCLNLNQILVDDGPLSPSFAVDGLHLNAAGYLAWKNEIKPLLS